MKQLKDEAPDGEEVEQAQSSGHALTEGEYGLWAHAEVERLVRDELATVGIQSVVVEVVGKQLQVVVKAERGHSKAGGKHARRVEQLLAKQFGEKLCIMEASVFMASCFRLSWSHRWQGCHFAQWHASASVVGTWGWA